MRSIADHIYDLAYNSVKAKAKNIILKIETNDLEFKVEIIDDGCGIDSENLKKVFDPFYTSRDKKIRKVGLGLSLLKLNTELSRGGVSLKSELGKGTELKFFFSKKSMNIPEEGDVSGTLTGLITCDDNILWEIYIKTLKGEETLTTKEIREILGDEISIKDISVIPVLKGIVSEIVDGLSL